MRVGKLNIHTLSKDTLYRCLDLVDLREIKNGYYGHKRKHAYITEIYFQRHILPKVSKSPLLSSGWIRFYEYGDRNKVCWIKIAPYWTDSSLNETQADKAFIRVLHARQPNCKFFILWVDSHGRVSVKQLIKSTAPRESWYFSSKGSDVNLVNKYRMEEKLIKLVNRTTSDNFASWIGFCEKWLAEVERLQVLRLLLERLLMNEGLYGAIDIDAIEVCCRGEQLIIHEFKRKYPTPNGAYELERSMSFNRSRLQCEVLEKLRATGIITERRKNNYQLGNGITKATAYRAFDDLLREKGFSRSNPELEFFGLDTSHCDTVDICLNLGFKYRHTIWWSKLRENLSQLLVSVDEAQPGIRVFSKFLDSADLKFFTRTIGEDSGSFNHAPRFQYAFEASLLKEHLVDMG